jgi:hypothetical protein
LDEAKKDISIIQTEVSIICQSEAEADNADRSLNNSGILRKPNSIIILLFIIILLLFITLLLFQTSRSHCQNKIINKKLTLFFNSCKIPGTYGYVIYPSCSNGHTRFICDVHVHAEIRKIICRLSTGKNTRKQLIICFILRAFIRSFKGAMFKLQSLFKIVM